MLSALLFLSLAKGLAAGMILSYAAPMPLMALGMWLGTGAAAVAALSGMVAVGAVVGAISALPFAVVAALPALVVVRQALLWRQNAEGGVEWYPPGLVLGWLTGVAMALIVIGVALAPGHPDGVQGWVAETIGATLALIAPSLPEENRRTAAEWWTPMLPAMVTGSWLVMAVVNAVAAQGLAARFKRSRRPSPAYRELELPAWPVVVMAAAGAVGVTAEGDFGYLARNLAGLALLPLAFLGLATIHRWVAGRPQARLGLAMVYGVLFLAFGYAVLAAAGLGLVRFVMKFRRKRDSGGGKEE